MSFIAMPALEPLCRPIRTHAIVVVREVPNLIRRLVCTNARKNRSPELAWWATRRRGEGSRKMALISEPRLQRNLTQREI